MHGGMRCRLICVNGWLRRFRTGCRGGRQRASGVSVSSSVRWVELARNSGGVAPKPQGGDQRSARIEAHAPLILAMVEKTPDVTLGEPRAALPEQGIGAGIATLWRFFARRLITPKKRLRMPARRIAPTS
jgi:transposase